jgi:hypothetical protein
VVLVSCDGIGNSEFVDLHKSLTAWTKLKKANGNSYVYQTSFVSWSGYGHITELRVEDGVVTSRSYQEFRIDEATGNRLVTDSYSETKIDLGSHEKGTGILTIDDLYDSCGKDYLRVNESGNTIYFQTSSDGVMTLCGFVPDNCQDDCFNGIQINSFEWIN